MYRINSILCLDIRVLSIDLLKYKISKISKGNEIETSELATSSYTKYIDS